MRLVRLQHSCLIPRLFHVLLFSNLKTQTPLNHSLLKYFSTNFIRDCNVKISSLFRAGKIVNARKLFDEMPERDVISWNAVVTGYWQNGCLEESLRIFSSMPNRNVVSWNSIIAGCLHHGRVDEAFEYFRAMPFQNTASWNAMISGLVKHGRVDEASMLFGEMPSRNVVSYTAMIDGYLMKGEVEKGRELFDSMLKKNAVSWTVMISGYVENGRFNEARELFELMPDKNVFAMTALVVGYCKEGKMQDARNLFEKLPCKDLPSWNVMITGYAQNGLYQEALKLFSKMIAMGVYPDNSTLVSVFSACSGLASLKQGKLAHVVVIRSGLDSNVSVCNALINMYYKSGCILDAELAFEQIIGPDLVSWNTIIGAFSHHGNNRKAVEYFNRMKIRGFEPDGMTFLSLLSAYGHAGKVDDSLNLFKQMIERHGIAPCTEHYACLIDTFSRAGQLHKACKLIQEMPIKQDSTIWGAVLAACSVYPNLEIAELAAGKIVNFDPQNSSAYVMLSNIYAAAGMWKNVKKVRYQMKHRGIKKQNANSWTEIGNRVHLFKGGDISHPDADRIYLELKRMSLHMKVADDTTDVILM